MKFTVSATSKIPSETANSIQVLMACQGLADAGQELTLAFPGQTAPDFDSIRAQYGLHCAAFPLHAVRTSPKMRRLDFCAKALYQGSQERPDAYYTWTLQLAAFAANLPLGTPGAVPGGAAGTRAVPPAARASPTRRGARPRGPGESPPQ